jgi:hypothetical protein
MEDRGLGRDHPGEEQAVEIERGGMVERADLIEGANLIQPFPLFQRIGIQRSGIGQKPPDRGPLAVEVATMEAMAATPAPAMASEARMASMAEAFPVKGAGRRLKATA